jgi:hypothetical protein
MGASYGWKIEIVKNLQKMPRLTNQRRGSTLLLVLAMLSILLLIGIAFTYSTRLETQASANYSELTQARVAATSGLPFAAPLIARAAAGLTDTLQDWSKVSVAMERLSKSESDKAGAMTPEVLNMRQAGVNIGINGDGVSGLPPATVSISDTSGRLNLNAINDAAGLTKVIQAVLPSSNAMMKANAIMTLKGRQQTTNQPEQIYYQNMRRQANSASRSRSNSPSQAQIEAVQYNQRMDPRLNNGQSGGLDSLARLRVGTDSKGTPLFTEKELQTLSRYVTVFSQAPEIYNLPNG